MGSPAEGAEGANSSKPVPLARLSYVGLPGTYVTLHVPERMRRGATGCCGIFAFEFATSRYVGLCWVLDRRNGHVSWHYKADPKGGLLVNSTSAPEYQVLGLPQAAASDGHDGTS